jgi:YHS domain-containing protein
MWSFRNLVSAGILALSLAACEQPGPAWNSRGARVLGLDSDHAEDPVSGRRVSKPEAVKREYQGSIYYFESAETAALFDRDPTLYAVLENVPPDDRADVK